MAIPLRERRRQLLRDEILQAAGALLNEKGYAAISMDELASCAGISKPTLYSHFANKEDLIFAAVMHWFDQIDQAVQNDPTPRTPLQQLTFVLRIALQMQIDHGALSPRPWSPEVFQIVRQREEGLARLRQIDAVVSELVLAGMHKGEINRSLDAAAVVRAFFALLNALNSPFFKLRPYDRAVQFSEIVLNPGTIADTLAEIFERGVRAPISTSQ